MSQELSFSNTSVTRSGKGWIGILAIALLYATLYTANFLLPNDYSNYISRIWNWSQTALALGACITLILYRQRLTISAGLLGFALAGLSALSYWLDEHSLSWALQEGVGVWACFLAGVTLFRKDGAAVTVPAFQLPLAKIGRSLMIGVLAAIPLAVVNNLYFFMNAGSVRFQNMFYSAFEALSPAIHEEIIFRFFVLAVVLNLLKHSTTPRWATVVAIFLAVVPHSLNHLPDLFLENPVMGLLMLTATSLLFGLPMAILQVKRNLETAIAFHWFIDFVRFLFGY